MDIKRTTRGFRRADFIDRCGQKCSIQESSLATEFSIWLGIDVNMDGEEVYERMRLGQNQVRELLPLLTHFAEHGTLPELDGKDR